MAVTLGVLVFFLISGYGYGLKVSLSWRVVYTHAQYYQ